MKQQLNKMKKSIGYSNEADIDDRIATIEFKMWTDTMTLKEEKKYLDELKELKRNRPKVSQVRSKEEALNALDTGTSLKGQVQDINAQMFQYREQKRGISEKLTQLMNERKDQMGDLDKIFEQRDARSKQIAEKIQERNDARDAFSEAQKEYNAYQAEVRKRRMEKQQQERQKWVEEANKRKKEKMAEKLDEQPHVDDMTLIEQTITFCKGLTASKGTEQKEKKEETFVDIEGAEVLSKKEDRDEYYFVPTAKGKKTKAKAKGGKAEGSAKPIKHNAETFTLFAKLKLDAPITTDDIPAILEKLEAKLEEYREKVEQWKATREERKKRIMAGEDVEEEEAKEEEAKEEEGKDEPKEEETKEEEAEAES